METIYMKFRTLRKTALMLIIGSSCAGTGQELLAGTTFVTGGAGQQTCLCSISSNGAVSNIDQSASASYGIPEGSAVDSYGNLYVAYSADAIIEYRTNGASLYASGLGAPNLLCFDNVGNLYGLEGGTAIKIGTNAASNVFAAGTGGLNGFCFDRNGNFFGSTSQQVIRITPGGITNVVATASELTNNFFSPSAVSFYSLTIGGEGNLYAGIFTQPSPGAGEFEDAVFRIGPTNTEILSFTEDVQSINIAVDETTNVVYSQILRYPTTIFGPFGAVSIAIDTQFQQLYVCYTHIDETLAVYAPTIILQPLSQTAAANASVVFRAGAVGTSPISYQWFFNQTNLIAGATNQILTLNNLTSNESGAYNVVASNYLGSATSQTASLSVLPTVDIALVPAISIYGGVGFTYNVQCINQYGPTNAPWITLATVTLTNTPQFYPDYSALGQPNRFYRVVQIYR